MKHLLLFENYHPGEEVAIRPATPQELTEFEANAQSGDMAEQNILELILEAHEVHGAFIGGKMVGGVVFEDHPRVKDATEIIAMYVDPQSRKKGIAKLLVQYVGDNTDKKMIILNPYTMDAEEAFMKIGFKKDEDIDQDGDPDNTLVKEI